MPLDWVLMALCDSRHPGLSGVSPLPSCQYRWRARCVSKGARRVRREAAGNSAGKPAASASRLLYRSSSIQGGNADQVGQRRNATLVVNDAEGTAAVGTFGDVKKVQGPPESIAPQRFADGCAAAICAEFARPKAVAETPSGRWHRVLREEAPRLAASL